MAELYDDYGRLVFNIAVRATGDAGIAEDLTQETFLRIWRRIGAFDESRGTLASWIATLARNTAVDYLRTARARQAGQRVTIQDYHALHIPDECLLDRRRAVGEAIARLSPAHRTAIALSYGYGMSQAEIAARLNRPLGTIKTWLRTALQALAASTRCRPVSTTTSPHPARSRG
jgi:RNA polymerase sigma-70 factor (ECF subfamily)